MQCSYGSHLLRQVSQPAELQKHSTGPETITLIRVPWVLTVSSTQDGTLHPSTFHNMTQVADPVVGENVDFLAPSHLRVFKWAGGLIMTNVDYIDVSLTRAMWRGVVWRIRRLAISRPAQVRDLLMSVTPPFLVVVLTHRYDHLYRVQANNKSLS